MFEFELFFALAIMRWLIGACFKPRSFVPVDKPSPAICSFALSENQMQRLRDLLQTLDLTGWARVSPYDGGIYCRQPNYKAEDRVGWVEVREEELTLEFTHRGTHETFQLATMFAWPQERYSQERNTRKIHISQVTRGVASPVSRSGSD